MDTRTSSGDKTYVAGALSAFPQSIDDSGLLASANDAETTLSTAINWSSTQVTVVDGSRFPVANGILRINDEMIFFGQRRGNIFDKLYRGHGQTYPSNHGAGTKVTAPCVADMNNAIRDGIMKLQRKVGLPGDEAASDAAATLRARVDFLRKKWFTPKAGFMTMNRIGYAPLGVQFRDYSIGEPVRWLWEFGDGTTSSEQHPYHEYKSAGQYNVGLTVFTSPDISEMNGVSAKLKHGYITVLEDSAINEVVFYVRNLSNQVDNLALQGLRPLRMLFVDQTRGDVTTRIWSFGDGSVVTVNDPNNYTVEHLYDRPGIFVPSLTVSDGTRTLRRNLDAQIEVTVG